MLIYEIASDSHSLQHNLPSLTNIKFENIAPSRFSFLTSMRLATRTKHNAPDAVFVYSMSHAMAAISARKIHGADKSTIPYPIYLYIKEGSTKPKYINAEIASNLDGVIFETEQLLNVWGNLKNFRLIPRTCVIPLPGDARLIARAASASGKARIGYVGPINDGNSLNKAIDAILVLGDTEQPELIVAGTGKARFIMPLVKKVRANKLYVEWLGDDYDEEKLLSSIDAFVPSAGALTAAEKRLLSNGIPAVTNYSNSSLKDCETMNKMTSLARNTFQELYREDDFVSRVTMLIEGSKPTIK